MKIVLSLAFLMSVLTIGFSYPTFEDANEKTIMKSLLSMLQQKRTDKNAEMENNDTEYEAVDEGEGNLEQAADQVSIAIVTSHHVYNCTLHPNSKLRVLFI